MSDHPTTELSLNPDRTVPKATTGIQGLDGILGGGFPAGALTLLSGGPGTGKTIPGLEFLYRGALARGIFVTPALENLSPAPGAMIYGNLDDRAALKPFFPNLEDGP